jgi:hypothetical protein
LVERAEPEVAERSSDFRNNQFFVRPISVKALALAFEKVSHVQRVRYQRFRTTLV